MFMMTSGNILHASRAHPITYFHERGSLAEKELIRYSYLKGARERGGGL